MAKVPPGPWISIVRDTAGSSAEKEKQVDGTDAVDDDDKVNGDVDGDVDGDVNVDGDVDVDGAMAVPAWRKRDGRKESGSCHRSGEKWPEWLFTKTRLPFSTL